VNKITFSASDTFSRLPLDYFNQLKLSVYVLDHEWNYLFVNDFVTQNLNKPHDYFIGKNMWQVFPELAADPSFIQLKQNSEKGIVSNFITISPLNLKRLNIVSQPMKDCYFFTATILPKKEDLIQELRRTLPKR